MERTSNNTTAGNAVFVEIVKKAYEKGLTEDEMTLEQLMADLTAELKNLVANY